MTSAGLCVIWERTGYRGIGGAPGRVRGSEAAVLGAGGGGEETMCLK